MRFKYFAISALVYTLTAVMLTGCFPTGEEVSIPESVSSVEGVTVELTPLVKKPESVPEITMRLCEWDNDKLIKLFLDGSEITNENSFDTVRNTKRYSYITSDDKWLILENGMILYRLQSESQKNSILSYYNLCYMPDLFPDEELEDFPKENALKKVYEIIGEVGLKHLGDPEIFAVTAEQANKLSTINTEWTKDDELYYIRFPIVYYGVPIADFSFPIMGTSEYFDGSYVDAAVSKSGVLSFNCKGVLGEIQKETDNIPIKLSDENALDIFKASFADREHKPLTIVGCTLTYVPFAEKESQEFSFKPAWRVEFVQESNLSPSYTYRTIYDANTGIEIRKY